MIVDVLKFIKKKQWMEISKQHNQWHFFVSITFFFAKIPVQLASKIPTIQENPYRPIEIENTIVFFKSSNFYKVPSLIFKWISHLASPITADLITFSDLLGQFPASLKTVSVKPIHKTGSYYFELFLIILVIILKTNYHH